jgi:glycosyltransferase involved in cell wall biosynthesis
MSYLPNSTTTVMQSHPQIHCTSYISDEQKVWYYQQASAVIIPSLSEGFGLPVLETLFYNKPLLLSNQAALPEIAGQTAIYFNPFDSREIAETIQHFIHSNQNINTKLYQDKLAQFSWQTTANKISHLLTSI